MPTQQYHYRTIVDADWPAIMRIQREVYYEFQPETEVVMRSKASHSLATCFVAIDAVIDGATNAVIEGVSGGLDSVVAYCLAHPYPSNCVAVLGTVNSERTLATDNLYVHDLAVQRASAGCGVAQALLDRVISVAKLSGYRTMSLVAVQDAAGFWIKMGFTPSDGVSIDKSYASAATFMTRKL